MKPWVIPIKLLLLNFKEIKIIIKIEIEIEGKRGIFLYHGMEKKVILKNKNQEEKEFVGQVDIG